MRLGPLEIGITIVVILIIAVVMRVVRVSRGTVRESNNSSLEILKRQGEERTGKIRRHLNLAGIGFILIGIVLLLAGISLLKWVFWSYLWSFIITAIGFLIIFIPKKR